MTVFQMRATTARLAAVVTSCAMLLTPAVGRAQVDYRNTDAGRPLRVGDAVPTARKSLEMSIGNARIDHLSLGRYRLQVEPRIAYGILPRTEIAVRSPVFFNERAAVPRSGVAGVGFSAEHQLLLESMHLPALALAGEYFMPTGPSALPGTYSVKSMVTRSLTSFRVHLNGSYGTYSVRVPQGFEKIIPPIHGACNVTTTESDIPARFFCMPGFASTIAATSTPTQTHDRWMWGAAIDKSLPLRSLVVMADVYGQKFRSINRAADWTAEVGLRTQMTRTIVVDAAVGRLFTGESRATYLTLGTTISRPLGL